MSGSVQKFLFETSFDPEDIRRAKEAEARRKREAERAAAEAAAKTVEPPQPEGPQFSEDDVEDARAAGYAEGEQAGHQAALAGIEQRLAGMIEQIPGTLGGLIKAQKQSDADLVEHAVGIAVTVGRKLFPELARRRGLAEIEAVVRDCLEEMIDEPRLVIRVSDEMLDIVRARLDTLVAESGFEGAIVCMADPAMGPSDCRVDWADGGAERLSARLWEEVEATIGRFFDYPGAVPEVIGGPAGTKHAALAGKLDTDADADTDPDTPFASTIGTP
ncbi:MAG: hypothetical protein H6843_08280 [Rhodospirillaceae bacterium]|nr:hypothetical protein [Rhodospirillaceae bacterium]